MDLTLVGLLVLGGAFLPYVVEVMLQLRLQARLVAALPELTRTALPRHPRRPWLAFLGSARFHIALWKYYRRDRAWDPEAIVVLKRKMRASLRRAVIWGTGSLVALAVLLALGWRPT